MTIAPAFHTNDDGRLEWSYVPENNVLTAEQAQVVAINIGLGDIAAAIDKLAIVVEKLAASDSNRSASERAGWPAALGYWSASPLPPWLQNGRAQLHRPHILFPNQ